MTTNKQFRKKALAVHRRFREWWMIGKALVSTRHPVMAHIIPIRRCNLACGYCNEYDDFSKPVPVEEMYRRIDPLGTLSDDDARLAVQVVIGQIFRLRGFVGDALAIGGNPHGGAAAGAQRFHLAAATRHGEDVAAEVA